MPKAARAESVSHHEVAIRLRSHERSVNLYS